MVAYCIFVLFVLLVVNYPDCSIGEKDEFVAIVRELAGTQAIETIFVYALAPMRGSRPARRRRMFSRCVAKMKIVSRSASIA